MLPGCLWPLKSLGLEFDSNCIVFDDGLVFNPSGAETRIFWENKVNTMAADALDSCVFKTSAAMIFNMSDKQLLVFHEEGFPLPVPFQHQEIMENVNKLLCLLKSIQHKWG